MVLSMTQAEVYTHATLKACQISSVAGAVAGTLNKTFTYRNFRARTIRLGWLRGARYGMSEYPHLVVVCLYCYFAHRKYVQQVS